MKVLVAIDGSKHSHDAVRMVAHSPIFRTSQVILAHVNQKVDYDEAFVAPEARRRLDTFNEELQVRSQALLQEEVNFLKEKVIDCSFTVLNGSVTEELCQLAEKEGVDLIVVGSRGLNPIKSFFLGSISDGLLRHAPCSVLIYRPHQSLPPSEQEQGNPLRIAIGYDDSVSARDACNFVQKLPMKAIRQIDLVSIFQMSFYYGMSYSMVALEQFPIQKKTIEESLVAMQRQFEDQADHPPVHIEILDGMQDSATSLNQYAKKHHCNLLVVGTKGKGAIDRILVGSVSSKLSHHAEVPLLVVRS